jgi:hypothetical protein
LLHVGEVSRPRDDFEPRAGHDLRHPPRFLHRRQLVLFADDDERGDTELRQDRRGVEPLHHPVDGAADTVRRLLFDQAADRGFERRIGVTAGLPEQLGHHVPGDTRGALAVDQRQHVAPIRASLG